MSNNFDPQFSYAPGPHWFAIYTNIKCEYRARAGLEAIGYRVYLPEMTKWITHARTKSVVRRPLMNRYEFVEIDPDKQGFGDLRLVDGVECLVGTNGVPLVIPNDFVTEMLTRQMSGEFDYANKQALPEGAKVRVVQGKYDGEIGIITSKSNANAGSVMVKLLTERYEQRIGAYAVRPYLGEPVDSAAASGR